MRRVSSAVVLLASLLVATVAAGRTWLVSRQSDPVLGDVSLDLSGSELQPAITGAVVLAAAATLVMLLTRGWPRRVSAIVLCLDGVWALWLSVSVLVDPASAAANVSGAVTGVGNGAAIVDEASLTIWPAVFSIAAGVWALAAARSSWTSRRGHPATTGGQRGAGGAVPETGGGQVPPSEQSRRENASAWDDLSDGKDPTQ
ncbi:hypothetical protein BH23ACT6_BH23ACT6_00800 [soil metagenome]